MIPSRIVCCATLLATSTWAADFSPADLYARLSPSVWRVVTYDADDLRLGQGSAVVTGEDTLTTNRHVLKRARRVSVQREELKLDARLELWDTERDLCRLTAPGLHADAVPLMPSEQLRVGQPVYAIGNPLGLASTLSAGLVSSLRRDEAGRVILVQTSAPISRASSTTAGRAATSSARPAQSRCRSRSGSGSRRRCAAWSASNPTCGHRVPASTRAWPPAKSSNWCG